MSRITATLDGPTELDQARVTAIEDKLEVGQLPIRYALAVDQRDVDAWVSLFEPDVDLGRFGKGREALREVIVPQLRWFYRSIHQIAGHRIYDLGPETARGQVYCRAEHEVGERWVVMAIRYDDSYRKVDGEWFFARRRERHWYAADINEHPQEVGFDSWKVAPEPPTLPGNEDSWSKFWDKNDISAVSD